MTQEKIHGLGALLHYSPVTHGHTKFELQIDDGKVLAAKPILGSMHRGAEKLFESRDYRQILMLANRHEWVSAFAGELGVAQLLEDALAIEVPEAAQWLRTLLMEYTRVTSHLAFVSGFPWQSPELSGKLREIRELWVNHISEYTGSRMHPMITRIGGLTKPPTLNWLSQTENLVSETKAVLSELETSIEKELTNFIGIGSLTNSVALEFAVSGPVARSTGYKIDLRINARGLMYEHLDFEICVSSASDTCSRIKLLFSELKQSLSLLDQLTPICSLKIVDEINVLLPKVIRVPEGVYTHDIETPLGIASWLLVSNNDKMPNRLKLRPASLNTLLATEKVLVGVSLEKIDAAIASMPFVSGDVDR